ncbi:VWA domain-containing protein [Desulfolithobacter sp.]
MTKLVNPLIYPFTALVGQDDMRLGLLLNAINPAVGGLLIRGEKGCAKSTAVRGLAALLPEIKLCELPLNVTEDRVAGGIDFAASLASGKAVFQPGLLAAAHGGMLYVDEVNLLDDHIVDLILAVAASRCNVVEREGISYRHPAEFILVGTMNPEEGELRPQFLDRFGLCVEVKGCTELEPRLELLLRREAFDRDPAGFMARYETDNQRLRGQILESRKRLPGLVLDSALRGFIAELCAGAGVAGHRADLVLEQATLALAALENRAPSTVHVRRLAPLVLAHRRRELTEPEQRPGDGQQPGQERQPDDRSGSQSRPPPPPPETGAADRAEQEAFGQAQVPSDRHERTGSDGEEQKPSGPAGEQVFSIDPPFRVRPIATERDRVVRRGSGRRSRTRVAQKQGRASRSALRGVTGDIALAATIRAAAPWQRQRQGGLAIRLEPADFRYRVREKRIGNLLVFVVDGSGSMGARGRMAATKGAILSLLLDAYQKRDRVTMISFRRDRAEVLLPITSSVELAGRLLADMAVGGRTPLAAGLMKGFEIVRNYLAREPDGRPIVILITDGRANKALEADRPVEEAMRIASAMGRDNRVKYLVIDTEDTGVVTFGLARRLATALVADYFKIRDLQAQTLVQLIRNTQ